MLTYSVAWLESTKPTPLAPLALFGDQSFEKEPLLMSASGEIADVSRSITRVIAFARSQRKTV